MRRIIVAGNWKMNKTRSEMQDFITNLVTELDSFEELLALPLICPPYVYLQESKRICGQSKLEIAAQDVSRYESGAYTGEISAPMLSSIGVSYCIIGHSERREYHNETDNEIRDKLLILRKERIVPIICVGEKLEEREKGTTSDTIISQLSEIFRDVEVNDPAEQIIAYEPVWAIGTGKTATPELAQEVHSLIREWLAERYSSDMAAGISILYGGSVKPDNFASLLQEPDIDGGLIGGASLALVDYLTLLKTGNRIAGTLQS